MKKRLFLGIIFMLSLFSCEEEKVLLPEGVLNKPTMVSVIVDVHIQEGRILKQNLNPDTSLALFHYHSLSLFKKHNTDSSTFRKSFEYYAEHPQMLNEIYQAVVDSLEYKHTISRD